MSGEDLDGQLLDNICWNSSGKLLAGSMDNMVNIWGIGGRLKKLEIKINYMVEIKKKILTREKISIINYNYKDLS